MRPRAIIFDVYHTLLRVDPPTHDLEQAWQTLLAAQVFSKAPASFTPPSFAEFQRRCSAIIADQHLAAKAKGIMYPEIYEPDIFTQALPELKKLSPNVLNHFALGYAQVLRKVSLMPGAAEALEMMAARGIHLGIASNAQPSTLLELEEAGLPLSLFDANLCFWSFQNGFSKPDAHVFQVLSARLKALNVPPSHTMMVGDRMDNDIAPAKSHGWQTWHLNADCDPTPPSSENTTSYSGNWERLITLFLASANCLRCP